MHSSAQIRPHSERKLDSQNCTVRLYIPVTLSWRLGCARRSADDCEGRQDSGPDVCSERDVGDILVTVLLGNISHEI